MNIYGRLAFFCHVTHNRKECRPNLINERGAGLLMKLEFIQCRQMIILLHELPGIGWHAIQKAVSSEVWKSMGSMQEEDLIAIGFKRTQAQAAARRLNEPFDQGSSPYQRAKDLGASVITRFDLDYPEYLLQIPQPPWVLYALGRVELLHRPSIAIVGTRNPTAYGRHSAAQLSEQLATSGMTVVSGLARGIDSKAHEAALRGVGSTIAVLASPVDTCYPPENRSLYQEIADKGLLLSETPIGSSLHPGMFPLRNRIIAGLTLGTLVIEAATGSGSLITAGQALEMSRNLYAVPGPISSPKSEGPNDLIGQGAKLVSRVGHILEDYDRLRQELHAITSLASKRSSGQSAEAVSLTTEEHKLIELLRDRPHTINELHQLTLIPFGLLSALLINLCIKRKIEQQPGSLYITL